MFSGVAREISGCFPIRFAGILFGHFQTTSSGVALHPPMSTKPLKDLRDIRPLIEAIRCKFRGEKGQVSRV